MTALPFKKLLVANRGEIAIHTHEDRDSLHRVKADEAYLIAVIRSSGTSASPVIYADESF